MTDLLFRDATEADLPLVVALYADDELGETREQATHPLGVEYVDAFAAINADPRTRLVVVEDNGDSEESGDIGDIVGTLQLSFIPHLVLRGGERAQIEAVRIRSDRRNDGLGEAMIQWAIKQARDRGCSLIQLTTNVDREAAARFYERLGFRPTHVGMKLTLDESTTAP